MLLPRYATTTFPPSLYHYIVSLGKTLVLVLNKIDLVPAELSAAWKEYFQLKYPQVLLRSPRPPYMPPASAQDRLLHLLPRLLPGQQDGGSLGHCFTLDYFISLQTNRSGLQFRRLKANFGIAKEGALQVGLVLDG